jgi:hypothetical protein
MSEFTGQAFLAQYELWITRDPDPDRDDVRPLVRTALEHLSSHPPVSQIAPCLAALYFAVEEFELHFSFRVWVRFMCWFWRVLLAPGRPMWNDFYMALWQLSRDPAYVARLHAHLLRAREKKNGRQFFSGQWMVNSVCQQDPEFATHWNAEVLAHGPVFEGF